MCKINKDRNLAVSVGNTKGFASQLAIGIHTVPHISLCIICPCVCLCQRMCPSCLFVWRCDNAEPHEAASLSVVAPCSWPSLEEVNWGQLESMGKGIRSPNTLLSSLGFCPDARHLKSARDYGKEREVRAVCIVAFSAPRKKKRKSKGRWWWVIGK